ncbi:copper homeostasis protein CutC [Priestia megaterium]|nr:copper homeostasis protein CutC [Priestia megaterium]
MYYLKEACVGNYEEARKAALLGADRIELCDNLSEGGTTPSFGTIALSSKLPAIKIHVLIRPRGDNFVYSDAEFAIMKKDIEVCKQTGVDGIVVGVLTPDNHIDCERLKELMELASPLSTTFHVAFDEIEDKKAAINLLADMGVERILTKGGQESALHNLPALKTLIAYADNRIVIMPGGGVNHSNLEMVAAQTGAAELHGTKIVGDLR